MGAMACSTLPVNTCGSSPLVPFRAAATASWAALSDPSPFRALISHRLTAQLLAELVQVDLVAVFAHQIDHVDRHHDRDAQFDKLGGQVEVALNVGAVDDIQDGVRLFRDQIFPGDHLFQRIGRERINARKVLDHHVLVAFQPAFLLFHRNAGPVADILAGPGQRVKQGGFAAVRVAGQSDLDSHTHIPLFFVLYRQVKSLVHANLST